jgi:hypothetical protein
MMSCMAIWGFPRRSRRLHSHALKFMEVGDYPLIRKISRSRRSLLLGRSRKRSLNASKPSIAAGFASQKRRRENGLSMNG